MGGDAQHQKFVNLQYKRREKDEEITNMGT